MHIIRCILNLGGGTQYHLMESPTPHSAQYQYQIHLQHAQLQHSLLIPLESGVTRPTSREVLQPSALPLMDVWTERR